MIIPCVKMYNRDGSDADFVEISLYDVNYIDMWQPTGSKNLCPAYHTESGSYLSLRTLKELSRAYVKYGFKMYDRSTIINEKMVKDVETDDHGSKIFFHDDTFVRIRRKL